MSQVSQTHTSSQIEASRYRRSDLDVVCDASLFHNPERHTDLFGLYQSNSPNTITTSSIRTESSWPLFTSVLLLYQKALLLISFQRDNSMLTFESASVGGAAAIVEKLGVGFHLCWSRRILKMLAQSLPFEKVKHQVSTLDAQPSGEHGGILILITGALLVSLDY